MLSSLHSPFSEATFILTVFPWKLQSRPSMGAMDYDMEIFDFSMVVVAVYRSLASGFIRFTELFKGLS